MYVFIYHAEIKQKRYVYVGLYIYPELYIDANFSRGAYLFTHTRKHTRTHTDPHSVFVF